MLSFMRLTPVSSRISFVHATWVWFIHCSCHMNLILAIWVVQTGMPHESCSSIVHITWTSFLPYESCRQACHMSLVHPLCMSQPHSCHMNRANVHATWVLLIHCACHMNLIHAIWVVQTCMPHVSCSSIVHVTWTSFMPYESCKRACHMSLVHPLCMSHEPNSCHMSRADVHATWVLFNVHPLCMSHEPHSCHMSRADVHATWVLLIHCASHMSLVHTTRIDNTCTIRYCACQPRHPLSTHNQNAEKKLLSSPSSHFHRHRILGLLLQKSYLRHFSNFNFEKIPFSHHKAVLVYPWVCWS